MTLYMIECCEYGEFLTLCPIVDGDWTYDGVIHIDDNDSILSDIDESADSVTAMGLQLNRLLHNDDSEYDALRQCLLAQFPDIMQWDTLNTL